MTSPLGENGALHAIDVRLLNEGLDKQSNRVGARVVIGIEYDEDLRVRDHVIQRIFEIVRLGGRSGDLSDAEGMPVERGERPQLLLNRQVDGCVVRHMDGQLALVVTIPGDNLEGLLDDVLLIGHVTWHHHAHLRPPLGRCDHLAAYEEGLNLKDHGSHHRHRQPQKGEHLIEEIKPFAPTHCLEGSYPRYIAVKAEGWLIERRCRTVGRS
mmetsp:Transcript_9542/g.19492  ORF Transcript_9542/g.19492 Transcript_9542/m.19492 type:complete len:211 (-) Transcript_9542:1465-2097(-)